MKIVDLFEGLSPGQWPLPEGWTWKPLGQIASVISRGRAPSYVSEGGARVLNQKCIRAGYIDFSFAKRTSADALKRYPVRLVVQPGDILWNSTGSGTIGRAAMYPRNLPDDEVTLIDTHITLIRPDLSCISEYLCHFLLTLHVQKRIADLNVGSTNQLELPRSVVMQLPIPVPPLAEQRRIVARIDELFAQIAEGEAALARARQGLDTWRRSLLKAAVTGELTSDWREANPSVGSGADIVSRIRRLPNEGGRRRASQGKLTVDRESLPQLPASWVWAPLGELGEIVGGVTVDKKRAPADPVEVPYLRVANVQRGLLDLTEVKTIRVERSVAARLALRGGDILLNEGGDRDKIGRGCVWREELPTCIHQNHVFRVRLRSAELNPLFISHYANEMGRRFFMEKGKQTTNLASISLTKISELPVPVPPAAEVNEIMRRLATLMESEVDNESYVNTALESVKALKQSVLKAAFEGRLGTSDAADRRVTRDTRTPAATTMALRQPIRAKA